MSPFESGLKQELALLGEQGLYRELRRVDSPQQARIELNGETLLNFSSNDYLGLANHDALKEAGIRAVERYGAGAGASRLICGSLAPHHELEEALAAFKASPAALVFSTGYAAALGTICALAGPEDVIVLDKLVHASIVDAARLSRAKLRVFRHNDLNHLEDLLRWAARQGHGTNPRHRTRVLVITESVFSMDGDHAPLLELVQLKETYGALLMLDEAHATGLYGANRRGLAEELGVAGRIEIQMGTLGKALGAAGGFICGSLALIDYLINRARSFIFSTAPVPAAVAAASAAIRLVQSEPGEQRRSKLWQLVSTLGSKLGTTGTGSSAIIPLHIGAESRAVAIAARLRESGILIPAIRYPTVARGRARLRLTLTADHTNSDLDQLAIALAAIPVNSFQPL
jgi:8-amino-7-oxononanoate synthase